MSTTIKNRTLNDDLDNHKLSISFDPGRVLSYMSYIGICGPKRYRFSSILAILASNRVRFLYSSLSRSRDYEGDSLLIRYVFFLQEANRT